MKKEKLYTQSEEILNGITHGVGTIFASAGVGIMILLSAIYGTSIAIISSVIYGISMLLMFSSSTLYHSMSNEKAKKIFRILDHCAIFLLIAGTYTPYTLITLKNNNGILLFYIIWIAAIIGIILNSIDLKKYDKLSLVCYVLMGWAALFAIKPLIENLKTGGIILLALGGIMYTAGIIFYKLKNKYMHGVWHLFVIAGALFHYLSIILYVIPTTF